MQLTFSGDIGINRLHLIDSLHQEDLLKWDSLQIDGIKGDVEPPVLEIKSITLSDYYAKVLIDKEERLNLAEAFKNKKYCGEQSRAGADAPPHRKS